MVRFSIQFNGCVWFFATLSLVLQHVHYTDWQYVGINLEREDYERVSDATDILHVEFVDAFTRYSSNPEFRPDVGSATHTYFNLMGRIHAAAQAGRERNENNYYHPPVTQPIANRLHRDTMSYLSRHQHGENFHGSTVNPLLPEIPREPPVIIRRRIMRTEGEQDEEDMRVANEYAAHRNAIVMNVDQDGNDMRTISDALNESAERARSTLHSHGAAGGSSSRSAARGSFFQGAARSSSSQGAARSSSSQGAAEGSSSQGAAGGSSSQGVAGGSSSQGAAGGSSSQDPASTSSRNRKRDREGNPILDTFQSRTGGALRAAVEGGIAGAAMGLMSRTGFRGATVGLLIGGASALLAYNHGRTPSSQEPGRVYFVEDGNLLTINLPENPTPGETEWYKQKIEEAIENRMDYMVIDFNQNIINSHQEDLSNTVAEPVELVDLVEDGAAGAAGAAENTGAAGAAGAAAISRSNRRPMGRSCNRRYRRGGGAGARD